MAQVLFRLLMSSCLYLGITQALFVWNCRLKGQVCQNSGVCSKDDGQCTCPSAYTGFACQVPKAAICTRPGSSPCLNGGTCEGSKCHCTPDHTGDDCGELSVVAKCNVTHMEISIIPPGTFSGSMYIHNQTTPECKFSLQTTGKYTITVPFNPPNVGGCGNYISGVDKETPYKAFKVDVLFMPNVQTYVDPIFELRCLHPSSSKVTLTAKLHTVEPKKKPRKRKVDQNTGTILTLEPGFDGLGRNPILAGQLFVFTFVLDFNFKYRDIYLRSMVAISENGGFRLEMMRFGCGLKSAKKILRKLRRQGKTLFMEFFMFQFQNNRRLKFNAEAKACTKRCRRKSCSDSSQFITGNSFFPIGRRRRQAIGGENETIDDEGETAEVVFDVDVTLGEPLDPDFVDEDGGTGSGDTDGTKESPRGEIISKIPIKYVIPVVLLSAMLFIATGVAIYMCFAATRQRNYSDTDSEDSLKPKLWT